MSDLGNRNAVAGWCLTCGERHDRERRFRILRRMLPASTAEIAAAYPCLWGGNTGTLSKDLRAIGARIVPSVRGFWTDQIWGLPE